MKIIVENEKDTKIIESLCDVALKSGGTANLQAVNELLSTVEKRYSVEKELLSSVEKKSKKVDK